MTTDPYESVPEPKPTDGPQEEVDWEDLEEEGHAKQPGDVDDNPE